MIKKESKKKTYVKRALMCLVVILAFAIGDIYGIALQKDDTSNFAAESGPYVGIKTEYITIETEVNNTREAKGLKPYVNNEDLELAADTRCSEMVQNNVYDHNLPVGYDFGTVIQKSIAANNGQVPITWGENIQAGNISADTAVSTWINSPSHLANILSTKFTDQGAAVCYSPNFLAEGHSYLFVDDFAQL